MAGGRPTNYTEQLGDIIADLIKMGKTIDEICSLDSMPCSTTFYEWKTKHKGFAEKCQESDVISADAMMMRGMKEVFELPRVRMWEDENGTTYSDDQVKELSAQEKASMGLTKIGLSSELVSRAKLINDATRHLAAIRNPEKYSEKRQIKMEVNSRTKLFLDGLDDE